MGCLSKHRQKQKCGYASPAWSLGRGCLHPGLHCHHCRFAVHHFSRWVEPRPRKGSSCVGWCHGGSPRSQCSHSPSPGAANRDLAELTGSAQGQHRILIWRVAFCQVSFCFVSVFPSSVWQGECVGPQKFIYHTVFIVLLALVGKCRSLSAPHHIVCLLGAMWCGNSSYLSFVPLVNAFLWVGHLFLCTFAMSAVVVICDFSQLLFLIYNLSVLFPCQKGVADSGASEGTPLVTFI